MVLVSKMPSMCLDDWSVERGKNHIDWSFRVLRVKFDNVHVMQWENVVISKSPEFLDLTKAYRKSANLSKKKNIAWYRFIS